MSYYKLSSYATVVFHDGNHQNVVYHSTPIVKWNNDEIILNSGGYTTATTKKKMNQTSNQFHLDFHVYQEDFVWYVEYKSQIVEFRDGMKLNRKAFGSYSIEK